MPLFIANLNIVFLYGGAASNHLSHLYSIQKRAVKLVANKNLGLSEKYFHFVDILPLRSFVLFKRGIFLFRYTNNLLPPHMDALFSKAIVRSSCFQLPLPRVDIFKYQSLSFNAPLFWNSLPIQLISTCQTVSLLTFKRKLKLYLFHHDHNLT